MNNLITIDSNVFKEQDFINYLIDEPSSFSQHNLSFIIYVEVLVWYEMIGLTRIDLDDDLEKIKTKVFEFPLNAIDDLLGNIKSNKNLPFRHHARDFLIGTQCKIWNSILITNNKKHFEWLEKEKLLTPQEFIQKNLDNVRK